MFSYKNNYYLYIDNTTTINLNLIKIREKYSIIYRNLKNKESVVVLKRFRQKCREKSIKFYVANDLYLLHTLKADGLYISAFNRKFSYLDKTIDIIGSAHNFKEIYEKKKQGCRKIFLSRLFKTEYKNKESFLGVVKFNLILLQSKVRIVPLGGIRLNNLNSLNNVNSDSLAVLSAAKKKPAISNRLF
jgi:thiamine monophosphate synthase